MAAMDAGEGECAEAVMANRLAGTAGRWRFTPDARHTNDKITASTFADKLPRQRACFGTTKVRLSLSQNRPSLMESPAASSFTAVPQHELEAEVIALLISALNLEVQPSEVTPDTPLYGDGLGLDSIDILEIALAVSKRYGFQMRSDDPRNVESFASIRALSLYIAQERTK
jgi:acyl carrier protein